MCFYGMFKQILRKELVMKKFAFIAVLLLFIVLLAACGGGDPDAVQQANENYDPGQARLDEGNVQAIMDKTKEEFSRNDVNFFTYRFKDGNLRMNARLLNEEIEEEFIQTFVDAFRNSQAETLEIELKDHGTYNIPLAEETDDYSQYFTPAE